MKGTKNSLKITAILCVFFFLLSCNNTVGDSDKSGVILIVTRIHGADLGGGDADYLLSDVLTNGAVFTNPVVVTLEATLKKPLDIIPGISYKTSIMIDRYTVTYTSPEGDPVPAAFEGRLAVVCEVDASVDVEILAVRADDKLVSPLSDLVITRGYIWAVAEIRFFGHDLQGYPVEAVGYLTVYFTDWADS